ncbi:MAG: hypothetical protein ACREBR_03470 [bacterium]
MDYVGSATDNSADLNLTEVSAQLRNLKLEYWFQGQTIQTNPEDLYKRYIALTPALPKDSRDWGFNIVDYFWNALTSDLQRRLREDGYKLPGPGRQTTSDWWMDELAAVRTSASAAYQSLIKDGKRMRKEMAKHFQPLHKKVDAPGGTPSAPVRAHMIGTDLFDRQEDDDSTISSTDRPGVSFHEPVADVSTCEVRCPEDPVRCSSSVLSIGGRNSHAEV